MVKFLITILLLISPLFLIDVQAQEFKRVYDCLPFEDSNGEKICQEYDMVCRDARGRYTKCPKDGQNNGNIVSKIEKSCRNSATGRFTKCPKELTETK